MVIKSETSGPGIKGVALYDSHTQTPIRMAVINDVTRLPVSSVLVSSAGDILPNDPVSFALTTMALPHYRIHTGESFEVGHYILSLADDGFLNILIQVGSDKELHLTHSVEASGDAIFDILEGTTFSAAGTALTAYNDRRRGTPASSTATFTHTPTITLAGTVIIPQHYIFGGTGPKSGGAGVSDRAEIILKVDTDYLLRLQNVAGSAKNVSSRVTFYEASVPV